jgi:hypothetical protein
MYKKRFLGIFTAVLTATSVTSCRDETSAGKSGKDAPSKNGPTNLADESNKNSLTNPLPPFVLKEGSYLLSERSASGQSTPHLEDFLISSAGSALAKEAGIEVKVADGITELALTKDLALAFRNMGEKNPISIKTQGHNLTLVGTTLKNLKVETKAAGQKSGDVQVYAVEEISGTFDLRGADGEAGADGLCPPGFDDCARVPGQAFAGTVLQPQIERRQEEQILQDIGAYSNRIAFLPFQMPSPPTHSFGWCVATRSEPMRKDISERFEGQLVLRRRVPFVNWQGNPKGQDGWLSAGQPGSGGQDAGNLTITTPPSAIVEVIHEGSGGNGGVTGLHGIVRPAPAPAANAVSLETQVELDATGASKVFKYSLMWSMTASNSVNCGRTSCICSPQSKNGEQKQSATNPILNWTESNDFAPPATVAGDMPALVEPAPAAPGADGIFEQAKNPELKSVSISNLEIPLVELIDSSTK